jgi:ATP-dependent Lon protease
VLDPAQNNTFVDTYLGVPVDLSKILFICTANTVETISPPLLDRMEVVALSGYTEAEKLHIARRYLLPKQIRAHGLREASWRSTTGRSGGSSRLHARGGRATAGARAGDGRAQGGASDRRGRVRTDPGDGGADPGAARAGRASSTRSPSGVDRPGVATGLAWTPVGGEILFVEAALVPGQGGAPVLTGMLGDVMRESAQAAVTFVRSNAQALGVDPEVFQTSSIHIHVPAGSGAEGRPVGGRGDAERGRRRWRAAVRCGTTPAMTGEITLPREGAPDRRGEGEGARPPTGRGSSGSSCPRGTRPTWRTCRPR